MGAEDSKHSTVSRSRFFINHGVHSVVIGPDNRELTGELSGSTSRFVEEYYQNKVVALFTMGPAGDQNPRYQNWDPNTAGCASRTSA